MVIVYCGGSVSSGVDSCSAASAQQMALTDPDPYTPSWPPGVFFPAYILPLEPRCGAAMAS